MVVSGIAVAAMRASPGQTSKSRFRKYNFNLMMPEDLWVDVPLSGCREQSPFDAGFVSPAKRANAFSLWGCG